MFKLTPEIKKDIQTTLNKHFNCKLNLPKIIVVHDPNKFFDYYEGTTKKPKKRSIQKMLDLDLEVSYFYDQDTKSVVFKGFTRSGEKSFKRIKNPVMYIGDLIHEIIHHYQYMNGGYGEYNLFEEATDEICRYVVVGDLELNTHATLNIYWKYIQALWMILDATEKDPIKKYDIIRKYVASKNKKEIHDKLLQNFVKKNPKAGKTVASIMKYLDDTESEYPDALQKVYDKLDPKQIVTDLYKIHDKFKPQLIDFLG